MQSKIMPAKRYKIVKDNEVAKPLQSRATNIKHTVLEPLTKSSKPSNSHNKFKFKMETKKQKNEVKRYSHKKVESQPTTVFNSDNVEIKLVSHNPFQNVGISENKLEKSGRLNKKNEPDTSLKFEDFDQPPQSTSTPILRSSSWNNFQNIGSFHETDMPHQMSPVLYTYNPIPPSYAYAYPYPYIYSHPYFRNDSPLQNKLYQDFMKYPQLNQMQTNIQHPYKESFGPIQLTYPMVESPDHQKLPCLTTEAVYLPPLTNQNNVINMENNQQTSTNKKIILKNLSTAQTKETSDNSSYRSSGGEATCRSST